MRTLLIGSSLAYTASAWAIMIFEGSPFRLSGALWYFLLGTLALAGTAICPQALARGNAGSSRLRHAIVICATFGLLAMLRVFWLFAYLGEWGGTWLLAFAVLMVDAIAIPLFSAAFLISIRQSRAPRV